MAAVQGAVVKKPFHLHHVWISSDGSTWHLTDISFIDGKGRYGDRQALTLCGGHVYGHRWNHINEWARKNFTGRECGPCMVEYARLEGG